MTVAVLRELFRNLQGFRVLYEQDGVDVLVGPEGEEYSLWDIETLYKFAAELPSRQHEAIELCLIHNLRERDAAVTMGVSETNPVSMYATVGLEKLVSIFNDNRLYAQRQSAEQSTKGL